MRRNSADQNYLGLFFFGVTLFVAQVISSLYPFIPSLAGFLFCYSILYFKEEEHKISLFFTFAYLSFYDLYKGFYLFPHTFFSLLSVCCAQYSAKNVMPKLCFGVVCRGGIFRALCSELLYGIFFQCPFSLFFKPLFLFYWC